MSVFITTKNTLEIYYFVIYIVLILRLFDYECSLSESDVQASFSSLFFSAPDWWCPFTGIVVHQLWKSETVVKKSFYVQCSECDYNIIVIRCSFFTPVHVCILLFVLVTYDLFNFLLFLKVIIIFLTRGSLKSIICNCNLSCPRCLMWHFSVKFLWHCVKTKMHQKQQIFDYMKEYLFFNVFSNVYIYINSQNASQKLWYAQLATSSKMNGSLWPSAGQNYLMTKSVDGRILHLRPRSISRNNLN